MRVCWLMTVLAASGCSLFSSSSDGGNGGGDVDMTDTSQQPGVDMADSSHPPMDFAGSTADLKNPFELTLRYRIETASIQSGLNNGFVATCGSSMAIACGDPDDSPSGGCTMNSQCKYSNLCVGGHCKSRSISNFTHLSITAKNAATGQSVVTMVDCPAGVSNDMVTIKLPDASGPFQISGQFAGTLPTGFLGSKTVDNVMPTDLIVMTIYACGCDMCL